MIRIFNFNGKTYKDAKEMGKALFNEAKTDPNCTNLVWEYQTFSNCTFVGGKIIYPEGKCGKGKCAYRGKMYEGDIEYKGNKLYVGGEYVKDID